MRVGQIWSSRRWSLLAVTLPGTGSLLSMTPSEEAVHLYSVFVGVGDVAFSTVTCGLTRSGQSLNVYFMRCRDSHGQVRRVGTRNKHHVR
jgi:hypothetical protein